MLEPSGLQPQALSWHLWVSLWGNSNVRQGRNPRLHCHLIPTLAFLQRRQPQYHSQRPPQNRQSSPHRAWRPHQQPQSTSAEASDGLAQSANNLSKAGWSWGCVSAIDSRGRTIWIADAHRGDGKRYVVRAEEKLTASMELESAIGRAKGHHT